MFEQREAAMKSFAFLVLFSATLAAQTEGVVVDAVTGAPLPGTYVSVYGFPPTVTRTDAAGHFTISGGGQLQVARAGYVDGINIAPKTGQETTIRLTPAAVIAGKLEDQDGFPVVGAQVEALQYREMNGELHLQSAVFTPHGPSDDRGEFRIGGVPPGRYYLRVSNGSATNWDRRYPVQYYGGTVEPKDENWIELKTGEQRDKLRIRLIQYDGVSVTGRIEGIPGPNSGQPVMVTLRSDDFAGYFNGSIQNDGTFSISHIVPGQYELVAQNSFGNIQAGTLLAQLPVDVGATGLSGITLSLHTVQAVDVTGSLMVEGGGTLAPMVVMLRNAWGANASAHTQPDGSFVVKGLLPGHYNIQAMVDYPLNATPTETAGVGIATNPLKAMLNDQDVLRKGIDIDSEAVGPLQITLGKTIKLSGMVIDAAGQPVAGTMISLMSDGDIGGGTTDAKGEFQSYLRTPGTYRAYVVTDNDQQFDPDYLKAHEADFPPIKVVAGENPPLILRYTAK
jgi:hypothetical protein